MLLVSRARGHPDEYHLWSGVCTLTGETIGVSTYIHLEVTLAEAARCYVVVCPWLQGDDTLCCGYT